MGEGEQAASMVLYAPEEVVGITLRSDQVVKVTIEKYNLEIKENWRMCHGE